MNTKDKSAIEKVLEDFNFDKAHHVMSILSWTWRTPVGEDSYLVGVPSIEQLIDTARDLLVSANDSLEEETMRSKDNCLSGEASVYINRKGGVKFFSLTLEAVSSATFFSKEKHELS